jgi:5-methyltetrahydrofolate--homocysteine methyltransferase
MTTTVPAMKTTIDMLHHEDPRCLVMVGGAVLTPEVAEDIHADYYARDAKEAVAIAKGIID